MPRQSVFGIVHRKNPPGAEVLYGPLQIGRKHVDIAPILAVLAVFEHGDIQIRKLACDVGEMGIVPAVAAEENPLRRSFDDERSPQRPVRPKRTSGKVPRGTAIYRKAAAERSLFAPIELRDPLQTSQKPRCSYLQRGFIFELSYICNTNLYSWLVSSI